MMIRCGKCGKMYDYDKYSGICPKCARYNRPDSREEMEQDMHDRYDTKRDPGQYDWYREPEPNGTERQNWKDSSRTFESYQQNAGRPVDVHRKSKAPVLIVVLVIIVVAAVIVFGASSNLFSSVRNGFSDPFADGWDTDYDDGTQDDSIDPEYQNRIYVDYAWSDYVGPDMSDIIWDDYYINVSTTEKRELEQLVAPEGYTYYIISMEIINNLADTYDLSQVAASDISLWFDAGNEMEESDYKVEKVFDISYPETESGESNYIDFLVALPDDFEEIYGSCMLNGNAEEFDCYLYQDEADL